MKTALFSLFAILFATATASAALTQWRTQVQASTGGNGPPLEFAFDGGLNDPSSAVTLVRSGGGAISEASSSLNADGFIPTLRARANNHGTRAQAVAWGVQGYTNTSASPLDTSLVLDLSATITGSNDVEARIYLFEDENFEFSPDPGTILFETSSQLWPEFPANDLSPTGFDIDINNFTGVVDEQRTFDFTVAPGDSFYVWGRLVVTADTPGVADAFSTLTASLTNTSGLEPAVVPEPSRALLLVLGALGFCLRRRHAA